MRGFQSTFFAMVAGAVAGAVGDVAEDDQCIDDNAALKAICGCRELLLARRGQVENGHKWHDTY
ncbi:exported hypothetical protein [Magnetospirillum molischianum DSM 120]|uniref:Uncharacterized protein n=1 Tax=Magnetospirillum molischianum DSM 120 TaxID=1150626 RepID=H8FQW1_MAGML|nr:exported hypothetical protein [Magnetospirillum molischianum DSM 120]